MSMKADLWPVKSSQAFQPLKINIQHGQKSTLNQPSLVVRCRTLLVELLHPLHAIGDSSDKLGHMPPESPKNESTILTGYNKTN